MSKNSRQKSAADFISNSHDAGAGSIGLDARMKLASPIILTLLVLVCLTPFLGKAFHIDDPLFLWAGKQIVQHPGNPYGFTVTWYTEPEQMSDVTQNPPLASYYICCCQRDFGLV